MREVVAYSAELAGTSIRLSRCVSGAVEQTAVHDWRDATAWLVQPPAGSNLHFTVCFNLQDFTKVLFSLLPLPERDQIERRTDRIFYQDCKIFYINGRYLGLTLTTPVSKSANIVRRDELNLQALKWWVSEDDDEPADVRATWELGTKIVRALDSLQLHPTKLTSPVAVFADSYLGDASRYPTIFSFPEDKLEAMQYAEEMMRHEWRSAYQVGAFGSTHLYDMVSAYPAMIARLPSTDGCRCEYATEHPPWATWGIMHGEVDVTADVSPLVYDDGDGNRFNPRGKWRGTFTTREIDWLRRWEAGSFKLSDGWFFHFGTERPYRKDMGWLHRHKNGPDKLLSTIARKMSQGFSGKLDEDRQDGKKGDFYNPVLAAMVRSETRLAVADFIYQHQLQNDLVAVLVDSALITKQVELPAVNGMGSWRYEGELPAIVLSKGKVWRPGKRPQGISYEQLLHALASDPESAYYEFKTASGNLRSIDLLLTELDRNFGHYPECGGDVLSATHRSQTITMACPLDPLPTNLSTK